MSDFAHRTILRREFDRIAMLTDESYAAMTSASEEKAPRKTLEKHYSDWAALLLRYHQAIEAIEGKESSGDPSGLRSMKERPPTT